MTIVECRDGVIRHQAFEDRQAAEEWAEWGHLCLSGHRLHEATAEQAQTVGDLS